MLCKCGCKVELVGRQREFASDACRMRYKRHEHPYPPDIESEQRRMRYIESEQSESEQMSDSPESEQVTVAAFSLQEIREHPTVLKILDAGPSYPIEFGSCCACGRKFTQEGFEKVVVCSTCFHRENGTEASSLQRSCSCTPTDREEDCSACRHADIACTHKFYWCAEHFYHSEQYCERVCV